MSPLIHLTSEQALTTLLEQPGPVFIDFQAPWCAPCRLLTPLLFELASTHNMPVVSIDVSVFPELSARFSVRGLPTLMVIEGGFVKESQTGFGGSGPVRALFDRYRSSEPQGERP